MTGIWVTKHTVCKVFGSGETSPLIPKGIVYENKCDINGWDNVQMSDEPVSSCTGYSGIER